VELFLQLRISRLLPKSLIDPPKTPYELTQEAQGEGFNEQGRAGPKSESFGAHHRPDRKGEKLPPGDQEEDHLGIGFAA